MHAFLVTSIQRFYPECQKYITFEPDLRVSLITIKISLKYKRNNICFYILKNFKQFKDFIDVCN